MYAAGKIPGSFFRREGRPTDHGHPHRPADRPAAAARRSQKGYRNETQVVVTDPRGRPGEPARRARHQRRQRGPDALGHPVRGSARRRAHRLLDRRASGSPTRPTRRATTRPSSSSSRSPARGRRRRHHDGRGGRDREGVELLRGRRAPGHRRGHRRRPRGGQELDPRVDRAAAPAGRQGRRARPHPLRAPGRLRRRRLANGSHEVGADRVAHVTTITDEGRAQRGHRRGHRRHRRRARRRPSRAGSGRSRRRCGR